MYKSIEIDIKDNKLFAQVAFLVDSLTFLDLLDSVRRKFGIKKTFNFNDSESLKNHFLALAGFDLKEYERMNKINPEDKEWAKKSKWLRGESFIKNTHILKDFFNSVTKIRRIHNYPPSFDSAIVQAILYNKVGSFETTKALLSFGGLLPVNDKNDQSLLLLLSPTSTKKEVLEAFKDSKKLREEYELTTPLARNLGKDTISTIRIVRDWHWIQLKGSTYAELVDDWNKKLDINSKDYIYDSNKVEQAVARYRRNLQTVMPKTDI